MYFMMILQWHNFACMASHCLKSDILFMHFDLLTTSYKTFFPHKHVKCPLNELELSIRITRVGYIPQQGFPVKSFCKYFSHSVVRYKYHAYGLYRVQNTSTTHRWKSYKSHWNSHELWKVKRTSSYIYKRRLW